MTFKTFIKTYFWTYLLQYIYVYIYIVIYFNREYFNHLFINFPPNPILGMILIFIFQMIYYINKYSKGNSKKIAIVNFINLILSPIIALIILVLEIGLLS